MLHDLVMKHVDSRGNIHIFQYWLFQESPTIIMLVHLDQTERKTWMNYCDGRQGTALQMLLQHLIESEVSDLVVVMGDESLLVSVTPYFYTNTFLSTSSNCV